MKEQEKTKQEDHFRSLDIFKEKFSAGLVPTPTTLGEYLNLLSAEEYATLLSEFNTAMQGAEAAHGQAAAMLMMLLLQEEKGDSIQVASGTPEDLKVYMLSFYTVIIILNLDQRGIITLADLTEITFEGAFSDYSLNEPDISALNDAEKRALEYLEKSKEKA